MSRPLFERLDEAGTPQKVVRWLLARRQRANARELRCVDRREGSHATALVAACPVYSSVFLVEDYFPNNFGAWGDYRVRARSLGKHQATLILEEPDCGIEFVLVLPAHAEFSRASFFQAKKVRITCEAERARLFSVRSPYGVLLAAGTLEVRRRAAFSRQLAETEPVLDRMIRLP